MQKGENNCVNLNDSSHKNVIKNAVFYNLVSHFPDDVIDHVVLINVLCHCLVIGAPLPPFANDPVENIL
jgi:hypothetical protein